MQLSSLYAAFTNSDVPLEKRTQRVEVELSFQLAFGLPLPAQSVVSTQRYFSEHCSALTRQAISEFNEQYPINVEEVSKTTFEIWKMRYDLVHNAWKLDSVMMLRSLGEQANYNLAPAVAEGLLGCERPYEVCNLVKQFVETQIPQPTEDGSL